MARIGTDSCFLFDPCNSSDPSNPKSTRWSYARRLPVEQRISFFESRAHLGAAPIRQTHHLVRRDRHALRRVDAKPPRGAIELFRELRKIDRAFPTGGGEAA